MALSSSSPSLACQEDCCKIQATLDRLSHLGRALSALTQDARRQIRITYRSMYGEDLIEHLHKAQLANPEMEISNILYLWMLEPHERDAVVAQDALAGIEADYEALIEIYTRGKSSQIFQITQSYLAKYKRYLDQDIISQQPHSYQKILVALATSHRSHNVEVSQHIAKCDAKRLYEAAKGVNGAADEPAILEMFSKRSIPQLRMAFSSYRNIYGHSFTKALAKNSCGEFGESLSVVVKCMVDPSKYYSRMLYNKLKRSGTSGRALSRLVLHGAESGMEEIKGTFLKKYKMTLQDAICRNVQDGDYREFLTALTNSRTIPSAS